MKTDIKSIESTIKSRKWYTETAPAVLQYCLGFVNGYVNLYKWFGIKGHTVEILHIIDKLGFESSIHDEREEVFEHLRKKGLHYLKKKYALWKKEVAKLINLQKKAFNLGNKSNEQLWEFYKKVLGLDIKQWSFSILSESADNFSNYELLPYLKEELAKKGINPSTKELSEAILSLCSEPGLSFVQKERLGFLAICRKLVSSRGKITDDIKKACKEHSERYYWITNNYQRAEVIPAWKFLSLAQKHIKDFNEEKINQEYTSLKETVGDIRKNKREYQKKYAFSKNISELLDLLALIGRINDERKEINLRTIDIYYRILKEIERRKAVNIDDLLYYLPKEIEALLFDNKKAEKEEIVHRQKNLMLIAQKEGYVLFSDENAKKLINAFESQETKIDNLRGFVACNGGLDVFRGKVSVVKDPKKETSRPGNILVTTMTRPDFIPLMRKASAVITDEGEISCHAAIVSREMNLPCIVGVKAGTKILKNNDMIEMNLRHGLVRII